MLVIFATQGYYDKLHKKKSNIYKQSHVISIEVSITDRYIICFNKIKTQIMIVLQLTSITSTVRLKQIPNC